MPDLDFAIPPPAQDVASSSHLSNKKKRKAKQLEAAAEASATAQAPEELAKGDVERAPAAGDEVKVLSHKEKRLAKKRKLALEADGETAPAESSYSGKTSAPAATAPLTIGGTAVGNTPARSAHGVWVGNLNFATHARELLAWFQERGLTEITRINMPNGKRQHENNRGFAYLDFPTATDVTIAVGLSEQNLDGRKLLIKSSSDYTGRPAPSATSTQPSLTTLPPLDPSALEPSSKSSSTGAEGEQPQTLNRTARKILNRQRNPPGPTLFLGNLGFETTVEDIRDMFDRNQVRSQEWDKKQKGEKKGKEKKRGEDANQEEEEGEGDEEREDTDGDENDSDSSEDEEDGSDDDDDDDDDDGPKKGKGKQKEKKEKGPLDLAKAKDAGIRKVRLGTFEDTGKCKGWAFVDFHLPAQATRALLNLHNHQLNGRSLNVEYASAEAVRRGALGTRAASKANGAARVRGDRDAGERTGAGAGGAGKRKDREWDDSDVKAAAAAAGAAGTYDGAGRGGRRGPPREGGFGGGREERGERGAPRGGKSGERAKPGAALAMAQRASEAIVASTGKKITFD
ncbi:hypothetical protein JCM21900_004301 [Sporobolomyces salmonicolor]